MYPKILRARRDALDDAFEMLTEAEFDIAERYIDKFIDYLEDYEPEIKSDEI